MPPTFHRPNLSPSASAAVCLIGIAAAAGCAGYHDPIVTVHSASLGEVGSDAATANFALELTNPNDEPLELREFQYTVSAEGRTLYTGRRAAQTVLNKQGTRELSLPAVLPYAASSRATPVRCTISGTLEYLAPGSIAELLFDTGVQTPDVSFSGDVVVDLTAKPATSPTTQP